jgi:glycosyltransferase involved in cell wall biosynthesis
VICILIPALNEEPNLRRLLPRIPRQVMGLEVVVVVVSDGSIDRTTEVVVSTGAILVDLPDRSGKGAALRAGLVRAADIDYDFLVTMDGDGQHDPDDLARLVAPVLSGRYDATFGSRYLDDAACSITPLNRFLVRSAMVAYLRRALGRTFTDPFCGYRCFTSETIGRIGLEGNGYDCELEALFDAVGHGLRVIEVPVRRIYGGSTSKMGMRGGAFLGRLMVLGEYVVAVRRKSRAARRMQRNESQVDWSASRAAGPSPPEVERRA